MIPGEEHSQVPMVAEKLDAGGFVGVGEVGLDFHFGFCKCNPPCRSNEDCIRMKKRPNFASFMECYL